MELENARPETPAMTFDELSMESSKSFVNALQELKNLRPQLYSAAEYCEKSYLHSEQKQTVLDNLKDYAVRALVNAVDHLGTVAYKLNDLVEQKTVDMSTMEIKVSCLNQQLVTCQAYMDKEGLRQQLFLAYIPRHHKHYLLPNTVDKRVHFSPYIQTDVGHSHFQARSRLQPSDSPASKTLSWHLASETKFTLGDSAHDITSSTEDPKLPGKSSAVFRLLDKEDNTWRRSSGAPGQLFTGTPTYTHTIGVAGRGPLDFSKRLTAFRSFGSPRREVAHAPVRSKSVLSAFFAKQKTPKLKVGSAS